MNLFLRNASRVAFYLLAVMLLAWTATNTYAILLAATGDNVMSLFGLSLFEGGMIAWLLYFLFAAEGIWQRTFALLGSGVDFLMIVVAVAIHLLTRVDSTWAGAAIAVLVAATLVNGALMWLSHLADPRSLEAIQRQTAKDRTMELAYRKLAEKSEAAATAVAEEISESIVREAHRELLAKYGRPLENGRRVPLVQAPRKNQP